jgi:hypothetical protein
MGAAKRRAAQAPSACPYHQSLTGIETPARIRALPVDQRGYPVPRFVAWFDGKPDHRVIDPAYVHRCIRDRVCWICGEPLGRTGFFAFGPACALEQTTGEPPMHRGCAEYAVRACPFLSRPTAHRRRAAMPPDDLIVSEQHIEGNPGVTVLWGTKDWTPFTHPGLKMNGGILFRFGEPVEVLWYTEGRLARRVEAVAALTRAGGDLATVGVPASEIARRTRALDAVLPR